MIIARWQVDARFGYKSKLIELMNEWLENVGSQLDWRKGENVTLLTGSVGLPEARIEVEHRLPDLQALNVAFDKLATLEEHKAWGQKIEPYVVSGSSRWVILRIID